MNLFRYIVVILCFLPFTIVGAQTSTVWQVYLFRNRDDIATDMLVFVDVATGEETNTLISGERYTVLDDAVLYYDPQQRTVMLATPDGETRTHPFIQPTPTARRIDWVLADDGGHIAWTITEGTPQSGLMTTTYLADISGADMQQIFVDDARTDGIRMLPVALNPDETVLYMDYQPDGVGELATYRQYAGLFALDIATGEISFLPGEPGCFCGAGFGRGYLLRLTLNQQGNAFDLRVVNLISATETLIPALPLPNYTQAGDILISRDGTQAIYAVSQFTGFGTPDQAVQTVFMLVDLRTMTQRRLTDPITTFVHPIGWTDGGTAILFASPEIDGTWKINIDDGRLIRVAEATYLGAITGG